MSRRNTRRSPGRRPGRPGRGPACPQRANVLLVGGGAREHALAWRLGQSRRLGRLWLTDAGNAGLSAVGTACPVPLDPKEWWRLQAWCEEEQIDLVVVGPEAPLEAGIAEALTTEQRLVFGPTAEAARIESDKAWSKTLMRSASIPTAEARSFTNHEQALDHFRSKAEIALPVIKASGLAAGKGVIVPETIEEGEQALNEMMRLQRFGEAGRTVVIEERLEGIELSMLALVDGRAIWMLEPCQDYKRIGEGDTGPNTGGMGACCPAPTLDAEAMRRIEQEIFIPALDALRREDVVYRGVLYAGIMLTPAGPRVLEFNCRFGDPECQPLMARFKGDLLEVMWATMAGRLEDVSFDWDPRPACCVVMASAGYPQSPRVGDPISGLDDARKMDDVVIFHGGTRWSRDRVHTAGGRVLAVTALGETLGDARDRALAACDTIRFDGAQYRRDIGVHAGIR